MEEEEHPIDSVSPQRHPRCPTCESHLLEERSHCPRCGSERPQGGWESNDGGPPEPWLGRVIGGTYLVTDFVGSGMAGTVYRARSTTRGVRECYAIKIIDLSSRIMEEGARDARERIDREMQTLASLATSHAVGFYDFLELGDHLVGLVTEYIDGTSLATELEGGALDCRRAAEIARQTAVGMEDVHRHGIVHRDLKPENLLLQELGDGEEFVRIIDFGVAFVERDARHTQGFVGTPLYASPEQFSGERGDARSDIYSLGGILFQMLAGRPPFEADSVLSMMRKHAEEQPPPLSVLSVRCRVPDGLEELVETMLAKEPGDRPASMDEVAERLEEILEGSHDEETSLLASSTMYVQTGEHQALGSTDLSEPDRDRRREEGTSGSRPSGGDATTQTGAHVGARSRQSLVSAVVSMAPTGEVLRRDRSNRVLYAAQPDGPYGVLWQPQRPVTALAMRDGRRIVGLEDGTVHSLGDGAGDAREELVQLDGGAICSLGIDSAGECMIAGVESARMALVHLASPTLELSEHEVPAAVVAVAVEKSAGSFAVALEGRAQLSLVPVEHPSFASARTIELGNTVCDLDISRDGHLVASLHDDGTVTIHEIVTHARVAEIASSDGGPYTLSFDDDGVLSGLYFEEGVPYVRSVL